MTFKLICPRVFCEWGSQRTGVDAPPSASIVGVRNNRHASGPELLILQPQNVQTVEYERRDIIVATAYSMFVVNPLEVLRYIGVAEYYDTPYYFFEVEYEKPVVATTPHDQR